MNYKCQLITLAGFHVLNYGIFDLAKNYKQSAMSAYSVLQQQEFAAALRYRAAKHQQFVGTGYFDDVAQTIAAGASSTTALHGSTEQEQFHPCARLTAKPYPAGQYQSTGRN